MILLECNKVAVDSGRGCNGDDCSGNDVEEVTDFGGKKDVRRLEGTEDAIETMRGRFDCILVSDCR